jgi:alpha-beta hydrolase superfamily lysophospholipase
MLSKTKTLLTRPRKIRSLKRLLIKTFRTKAALPPSPAINNKRLVSQGFNNCSFKLDETAFECHHYPAKNATELRLFITGCHTRTAHYSDRISEWADNGHESLIANLRISSRKAGFTNSNHKMVEYILTHDQSPALRIAREKGLPIKVMAHSYGGNLLTGHLLSRAFVKTIAANNVKGILMLCPYFSAIALDRDILLSRFVKRPIFELLAQRNPYIRPNESLGGTIFEIINYHLRGEPTVAASNGFPTMVQVTEMQNNGDRIRDRVAQEGFPEEIRRLPIIMAAGKWDKLSGENAIKKVADAMGATHVKFNGWHNPVTTNPNMVEDFLRALDNLPDQISKTLEEKKGYSILPPPSYAASDPLPKRALQAC